MITNPSGFHMAAILVAGIIFVHAADAAKAQQINPATGLPAAAANPPQIDSATGLPVVEPGKIDPVAAVMRACQSAQEVQNLTAGGQYEDALQRCLSFQSQLKGDQTLIPLISAWVELGRRFPKAREALIEIRDQAVGEFSRGRGYSFLFSEVSAINSNLGQEDATYALFMSINKQDQQLAQQCYGCIAPLLIQRGEFELCLNFIGDPEEQFDSLRQSFSRQLDSSKRMAELKQKTAQQLAEINRQLGFTNAWTPPDADTAAFVKTHSENDFIGATRQLIEILVGASRQTEAKKIRAEAVAVLDNPRLNSAVSDAEEKIHANAKRISK